MVSFHGNACQDMQTL